MFVSDRTPSRARSRRRRASRWRTACCWPPRCLRRFPQKPVALGASWERTDKSTLRVTGIGGKRKPFPEIPRFDCGESGSTLRFLIPIALAVAGGGVFTGRGRLMERPQKPYFDLFDEKGISYEQTAGALTVRGALTPGEYRLAGNV